jgi:hypothetical protein
MTGEMQLRVSALFNDFFRGGDLDWKGAWGIQISSNCPSVALPNWKMEKWSDSKSAGFSVLSSETLDFRLVTEPISFRFSLFVEPFDIPPESLGH